MTYLTGANLIQVTSVSIKQVSISITNACREIEIDLSVGLLNYHDHQSLFQMMMSSLLFVGGYRDGVKLSSLEMIGDNPCSVADFPHAITGHVAVLTPDGFPLLLCGSSDNPDPHDCYKYDVSNNQWHRVGGERCND